MPTSRRDFLRLSTGGGTSLGSIAPLPNIPRADAQLRILVLGGTSFLGVHQVNYALARGHRVTLFNRGRTNTDLFPEVEKLRGDRNDDLTALEGREWDVVIDNSASVPRWVRQSAELLKHSANQYIYVSSLSVIADNSIVGADESIPVAQLEDPTVEQITGQKTLSARKVEILYSKFGKNGFHIKHLLKELANRDMNSILIEGGAELNASVLKAGVVDRVVAFISPILIGGSKAPGFLGGLGVMKVNRALKLKNLEVTKIGEDLMVEATPCLVE